MKTSRHLTIFGALLVSSGCSTSSIPHAEMQAAPPLFQVDSVDIPEKKQFELVLRSNDSRRICLSVDQWPNSAGKVNFGSDIAKLQFSSGSINMRDSNFGYCPGGCGLISIEPASEIRATIPYSEFGDPSAIEKLSNKQLIYTIVPRYCERR